MRCASQYEWELYQDGEQPQARREELKNHLAKCPACSELVDTLRRESSLISGALAATPLPSDLEGVIRLRLAAPGDDGGRPIWFLLPVIGLAGVFIALYNGWTVLEQFGILVRYLGFRDLLLQFVFAVTGIMIELAKFALRGQSVLPALTVLILCMFWMRIKILRGGRANV